MPLKKLTMIALATLLGVSLCTSYSKADDDDDEGIVRISDGAAIASSAFNDGRRIHPSPFNEWVPPSTYPVHPGFFYYRRYHPDYWAGQPQPVRKKTAQVIFTPTDTTQLGYYYQHVPVWQPNPSMIPPEPHPATWHNWSRQPANVVWTRRGLGQPIGVVAPQHHPFMHQVANQGFPVDSKTVPIKKKPNTKLPVPKAPTPIKKAK